MSKGCNNCKHYNGKYVPRFSLVPDGSFYMGNNSFGKCNAGNNRICAQWWLFNGSKTDPKELEDMPCFEPHELNAALDDMIKAADDLLNKLKEK